MPPSATSKRASTNLPSPPTTRRNCSPWSNPPALRLSKNASGSDILPAMLLLVALGGNAVGRPGEEGNIPQQFAATRAAMRPLADLILAGHRVVITHGNGPQVGNTLRRVEIAARAGKVYPLPLDVIVADTEAGMGYMICQCLMNEFAFRGKQHVCTTIITTVLVEENDPAFKKPDKPIGP